MKGARFWVALLIGVIGVGRTWAKQEGSYTYYVANGKAYITDYDNSYSGSLTITNSLGGYPVAGIVRSKIVLDLRR